jgi:hypothetical protein
MVRTLGWLVIGILSAAAAYELALALGAGSLGPNPGDDVAGSGVVEAVALLAMLAAVPLGIGFGVRPWRPAALVAPAAAAYLSAFYFTYDPYFAPNLRRYSEGNVAGVWIATLATVALAVGAVTSLRPRVGAVLTSVMLPVLFVATLLAGDGH